MRFVNPLTRPFNQGHRLGSDEAHTSIFINPIEQLALN
jgi:hypothetical protein